MNSLLECLRRRRRLVNETIHDLERRIPDDPAADGLRHDVEALVKKREAISTRIAQLDPPVSTA